MNDVLILLKNKIIDIIEICSLPPDAEDSDALANRPVRANFSIQSKVVLKCLFDEMKET